MKIAYREHWLTINLNDFITPIKTVKVSKPYLTLEELLSERFLFGLLLVGEGFAGRHVLRRKQDVVRRDVALLGGVDGELLVGGVERAALGIVERIEILIQVVRARDAVIGLAAHAKLGDLGLKSFLAAVLVNVALVALGHGGLLLGGKRHAVLAGEIFKHQVLLDGRAQLPACLELSLPC